MLVTRSIKAIELNSKRVFFSNTMWQTHWLITPGRVWEVGVGVGMQSGWVGVGGGAVGGGGRVVLSGGGGLALSTCINFNPNMDE